MITPLSVASQLAHINFYIHEYKLKNTLMYNKQRFVIKTPQQF